MGGITLDLHLFSWCGEHCLLTEVREDDNQRHHITYFLLIGETTVPHLDGVHSDKATVRTVYQELTLVDITQTTRQAELIPFWSARQE